MLINEQVAELESLYKEISEYTNLYRDAVEKAHSSLPEQYSALYDQMITTQPLLAREIRSRKQLVSEPDQDLQDIQQVFLHIQGILTDNEQCVYTQRLEESKKSILDQLKVVLKYQFSPATETALQAFQKTLSPISNI